MYDVIFKKNPIKFKKSERVHINGFIMEFIKLEKQTQTKYILSQQQKIIKTRTLMNETETKTNNKEKSMIFKACCGLVLFFF